MWRSGFRRRRSVWWRSCGNSRVSPGDGKERQTVKQIGSGCVATGRQASVGRAREVELEKDRAGQAVRQRDRDTETNRDGKESFTGHQKGCGLYSVKNNSTT